MPVPSPPDPTAAAVDLGSNSFHMVIAEVDDSELRIVDKIRERVQLAAGLDPNQQLAGDVWEQAIACLARFGQRLRGMPQSRVRAVGTNTLRVARNARQFIHEAERALGYPVEVIGGAEEARLIYLGVSHTLGAGDWRRLVVDIGGGSTEIILGERFEPLRADSLHMGCVSYSLRFFPDGVITRDAMQQAIIAAELELSTIERRYRTLGWDACAGSSGTIRSIEDVLRVNGWSDRGITLAGISRLRKAVLTAGHVDRLGAIEGLKPDRSPVLPGGLAILLAVFESLAIEQMMASSGALREGILYDLRGRIHHEDVRDRTIARFSERFGVDVEQAARVERTALKLLRQVAASWALTDELDRQALVWASRLHELGLALSYSGYHKHGAYIVANADMLGFSRAEQLALAAMIRSHRRKVDRSAFDLLPDRYARRVFRLSVLLRLAVLLNRSRSPDRVPIVELEAADNSLKLAFPAGWLEEHPLTRADLAQEQAALQPAGFTLEVQQPPGRAPVALD